MNNMEIVRTSGTVLFKLPIDVLTTRSGSN